MGQVDREGKVQLNVWVDLEQRAALHRAARAEDLRAGQLVRRLIREHLERVDQEKAA